MNENNEEFKQLIKNDDNVEWRSCCFVVNKNFLKYIIQVFISLIIIGLSSYKLVIMKENEDKSIYISLLTLIVGVYIPVPSPH